MLIARDELGDSRTVEDDVRIRAGVGEHRARRARRLRGVLDARRRATVGTDGSVREVHDGNRRVGLVGDEREIARGAAGAGRRQAERDDAVRVVADGDRAARIARARVDLRERERVEIGDVDEEEPVVRAARLALAEAVRDERGLPVGRKCDRSREIGQLDRGTRDVLDDIEALRFVDPRQVEREQGSGLVFEPEVGVADEKHRRGAAAENVEAGGRGKLLPDFRRLALGPAGAERRGERRNEDYPETASHEGRTLSAGSEVVNGPELL